jgi:hypothetical protein
MADVKEKLVEVVRNLRNRITAWHTAEDIADLLIANGVTVQEWISVKDRLPEKEQDVLCSRGNHIGALMDVYTYMGDDKWDDTYGNRSCAEDEGITHWQYLPQPPKGE